MSRTGVSRRVRSTDGVELAVYEHGNPDAPTIMCVHGYPDNHAVWDGVVQRLAGNYHVVTYDVRGAGASGKPCERSAYLLDQLEADLGAVLDAVSPRRPAHLLAHDWGSIQCWHAVTGQALSGRIASYTSMSGPSLDHAGRWMRERLRPNPRALRELTTQLLFSAYIGFFHLAPLPELLWRSRFGRRLLDRFERIGAPADAPPPPEWQLPDLLNGLALYRANMRRRLSRPVMRRTGVPVQVLAARGDLFVSLSLQSDIGQWAPDLRVHPVRGGHWLPRHRPDVVARYTTTLVDEVERRPAGEARETS